MWVCSVKAPGPEGYKLIQGAFIGNVRHAQDLLHPEPVMCGRLHDQQQGTSALAAHMQACRSWLATWIWRRKPLPPS